MVRKYKSKYYVDKTVINIIYLKTKSKMTDRTTSLSNFKSMIIFNLSNTNFD